MFCVLLGACTHPPQVQSVGTAGRRAVSLYGSGGLQCRYMWFPASVHKPYTFTAWQVAADGGNGSASEAEQPGPAQPRRRSEYGTEPLIKAPSIEAPVAEQRRSGRRQALGGGQTSAQNINLYESGPGAGP